MGSSYVHGLKNVKRRRWDLVVAAVVLVGVAGALLYLFVTTRNSSVVVDNSKNQPISKVFGAVDVNIFEVREELFEMDLEGDWEQYQERPNEVGVYRYKALGFEHGREIEVFIDSLPKERDLYMTHVLPISQLINSERVQTDELSDLCRKFAPIQETQIVGVVTARWKDIEFDCDVHRYRNIVGTATKDGYGLVMTGANGQAHNFFFRYTDHGAQPNNVHFLNILETFRITY